MPGLNIYTHTKLKKNTSAVPTLCISRGYVVIFKNMQCFRQDFSPWGKIGSVKGMCHHDRKQDFLKMAEGAKFFETVIVEQIFIYILRFQGGKC